MSPGASLGAGPVHAGAHALGDGLALQLGPDHGDVEERLAHRRRGVDPGLLQRAQTATLRAQVGEGLGAVQDAPEGPVDAPDQNEVNLTAPGQFEQPPSGTSAPQVVRGFPQRGQERDHSLDAAGEIDGRLEAEIGSAWRRRQGFARAPVTLPS
jgi:hypothetical protein